ncbi:hypothetical protein P256_00592 [Acinetobacter nectaris CIP 110549]|uniref:CvpA family protein n=1 Tax=Acinetobacter nectaris CIP 110549 TaxID=1392540 RepID=V2TRD9_9GAMM|nr:hypothetical protein P256_00592 [Acinetobacter nectaris CIP 110549]
MNILDVIVVIVVVLGGINGLRQGLIQALANLVGWVLALFMGAKYANDLAPMMSGLSHDLVVQKIAGFAFVVLVVMALTWLVSAILNKLLKSLKLGPLNRLAGGILGCLKSLFVMLIAMQGAEPWVHTAQSWKQSKMVQVLMPYAPIATEVSKEVATEAIQHFHDNEARVEQHSKEIVEKVSARRSSSEHSAQNPFN